MKSFILASVLLSCFILNSRAMADSRPVLVVVGMNTEEKIVEDDGIVTVVSAGNGQHLRDELSRFDFSKVRAVISFGIAGGLNPALKAGDLAIAASVSSETKTWATSPEINNALTARFLEANLNVRTMRFYGVDHATSESKAAIRARTGADTIDTESHIAAEFAAAHGLPFAALRAVSDAQNFVLPPAALLPLLPSGDPDTSAIFQSLMKNPWQVPALIATAFNTDKAYTALNSARAQLDANDLAGTPAPNQSQTCASMQEKVNRLGAAILTTGPDEYERVVRDSAFCETGYSSTEPEYIGDCFVGYTCY